MSGAAGNRREQLLTLKNREGRILHVRLRQYRHGDEPGMIACIRDEYGSTYFKRNFYLPEQIKKESDCGHITFLVAETVPFYNTRIQAKEASFGEIAGMMILKEFTPKESMCEIASQIFKKEYRGYGLAMPFFEYGMEILTSRRYSAAYCLPVLFHDTTQRLLYRLGLRATGLILNVFHMGRITHSYHRDRNKKHSQGIQIRALGKKDAGMLYLPPEHTEFCRGIYDSLGVAYRVADEKSRKQGKLPAVSEVEWKQDTFQCSLEIRICKAGKDLPERITELHSRYPLTGLQTANIFLNINDRNALWAYRSLTEAGYFFTGLKPLCSDKEYMVLHNAGRVEMWLEDYVVTEEFKQLVNYIKEQQEIRI